MNCIAGSSINIHMYSTVNASSLVFNLCTGLCLSQKVFTLVFKYFYHTGNNQVGSL